MRQRSTDAPFGEFLLTFPGPLETERDRTPIRSADIYFGERAARGDIEKAKAILAKAGRGNPPEPGDEIEESAS